MIDTRLIGPKDDQYAVLSLGTVWLATTKAPYAEAVSAAIAAAIAGGGGATDAARSATAAPPVEVGAIAWQDKALAHLAVVRVLMPPQDVLLVQDFINDSRMKGEPVDHGYDRTASLSAGRYVCTCGGACSHYTTEREQPK